MISQLLYRQPGLTTKPIDHCKAGPHIFTEEITEYDIAQQGGKRYKDMEERPAEGAKPPYDPFVRIYVI